MERYRVAELRPSQILLTFGIGAVVDLPGLPVMIMGPNDWDISRSRSDGRRSVEPQALGRLLQAALDDARLCASDPLCAEHHPWRDGQSLHAAARRGVDVRVLVEDPEASDGKERVFVWPTDTRPTGDGPGSNAGCPDETVRPPPVGGRHPLRHDPRR